MSKTLPQTADGQGVFGDFNNDGIPDFFIIAGQGKGQFRLYKGNGDGTFTQVENNELYGKNLASAAFIDYNNDGNPDLISIGQDDYGNAITDFFVNTGAPDYNFVWDMKLSDLFPYLHRGGGGHNPHAIAVFDYNNDGWPDILLTGYTGNVVVRWEGNNQFRVVALFKNKQDGTFEYVANPVDGVGDFEPVNGGSVDVADYNHDGWMDILVSGYKDSVGGATFLYKNNGNGTFSKVSGINFIGQYQGETAFIDINNDGYADIVEFGRNLNDSWRGFSKIFINNQDGTFTRREESQTNIGGACFALAVGDVNNDGWIDFLTSGWDSNNVLYYNNGDEISFTPVNFIPKDAIARDGSVCFADLNNDGFLDMHCFGYHDPDGNDALGCWPNYFALNKGGENVSPNRPPSVPANLQITYNRLKNCYDLSWDKSEDDTTPQDAIRYNIYVKHPNGKTGCLVPADIATGTLKVAGLQAFIPVNKYSLYIPETDGIEIGVQAIDNGWKGSAFAIFGKENAMNQLVIENVDVYIVEKNIHIRNNNSDKVRCRIMTIDGKLLGKSVINVRSSWSSGQLEPGVYLIETTMGKTSQTVKRVVF